MVKRYVFGWGPGDTSNDEDATPSTWQIIRKWTGVTLTAPLVGVGVIDPLIGQGFEHFFPDLHYGQALASTNMMNLEVAQDIMETIATAGMANLVDPQNYQITDMSGRGLQGVTATVDGIDQRVQSTSEGFFAESQLQQLNPITQAACEPAGANPWNTETSMRMYVPETSTVKVQVFNVLGQPISSHTETLAPGAYMCTIDNQAPDHDLATQVLLTKATIGGQEIDGKLLYTGQGDVRVVPNFASTSQLPSAIQDVGSDPNVTLDHILYRSKTVPMSQIDDGVTLEARDYLDIRADMEANPEKYTQGYDNLGRLVSEVFKIGLDQGYIDFSNINDAWAGHLRGEHALKPIAAGKIAVPMQVDDGYHPIGRWDYDNSGVVDFTDFFKFVEGFGKSVEEFPQFDQFDSDGSGTVDFNDFFAFVGAFGKTWDPVITPTEFAAEYTGQGTEDITFLDENFLGEIFPAEQITNATLEVTSQDPNATVSFNDLNQLVVEPNADYEGPINFGFSATVGDSTYVGTGSIPFLGTNDMPTFTVDAAPDTVWSDAPHTFNINVSDVETPAAELERSLSIIGNPTGVTVTQDGDNYQIAVSGDYGDRQLVINVSDGEASVADTLNFLAARRIGNVKFETRRWAWSNADTVAFSVLEDSLQVFEAPNYTGGSAGEGWPLEGNVPVEGFPRGTPINLLGFSENGQLNIRLPEGVPIYGFTGKPTLIAKPFRVVIPEGTYENAIRGNAEPIVVVQRHVPEAGHGWVQEDATDAERNSGATPSYDRGSTLNEVGSTFAYIQGVLGNIVTTNTPGFDPQNPSSFDFNAVYFQQSGDPTLDAFGFSSAETDNLKAAVEQARRWFTTGDISQYSPEELQGALHAFYNFIDREPTNPQDALGFTPGVLFRKGSAGHSEDFDPNTGELLRTNVNASGLSLTKAASEMLQGLIFRLEINDPNAQPGFGNPAGGSAFWGANGTPSDRILTADAYSSSPFSPRFNVAYPISSGDAPGVVIWNP